MLGIPRKCAGLDGASEPVGRLTESRIVGEPRIPRKIDAGIVWNNCGGDPIFVFDKIGRTEQALWDFVRLVRIMPEEIRIAAKTAIKGKAVDIREKSFVVAVPQLGIHVSATQRDNRAIAKEIADGTGHGKRIHETAGKRNGKAKQDAAGGKTRRSPGGILPGVFSQFFP